jgi:hypothetical protein
VTTPFTLELWSTRKNSVDPSTFVGDFQRLFYNPVTKSIRVSDGQTPGGLPISDGESGSVEAIHSSVEPVASPNGLLWFNPEVDKLYVASNNAWIEVGSGQGQVALYSISQPDPSTNGLLWYNPNTSELSIADNNSWVLFTGGNGGGGTGFTGSQGNTGFVGSKGEIGYTGSQGEIGFTGSQGEIGYTGSQG